MRCSPTKLSAPKPVLEHVPESVLGKFLLLCLKLVPDTVLGKLN